MKEKYLGTDFVLQKKDFQLLDQRKRAQEEANGYKGIYSPLFKIGYISRQKGAKIKHSLRLCLCKSK